MLETKPKLISQSIQTENCQCHALVFLTGNDLLHDGQHTAQFLIKFTGHTYSQDNLLPIDDSLNNSNQIDKDLLNKEFLVCAKTLQFTQLCHDIKHLKMNYCEICQQKALFSSKILNFCKTIINF